LKKKYNKLEHIKNIESGNVDEVLKKWEETGLLDNITSEYTGSIAELMECEAKQLLNEETMYNEIEGDLILLAKKGKFDVITHGCNCMSNMGAGIAVPMNFTFDVSQFPMELQGPSPLKLGNIDYVVKTFTGGTSEFDFFEFDMAVVNSYTQNRPGIRFKPLDYEALTLCMRKINHTFKGKHIGLPYVIGAGLAGGDKKRIKEIIKTELKDCKITLVKLPNNPW